MHHLSNHEVKRRSGKWWWNYPPIQKMRSRARVTSKQRLAYEDATLKVPERSFDAYRTNRHLQLRAQSSLRRQHDIFVAHTKRNDAMAWDVLQSCTTRAGELLVVSHDSKYLRLASKNDYEKSLEVGPEYFAVADRLRKWHFGLDCYYDDLLMTVAGMSPLFCDLDRCSSAATSLNSQQQEVQGVYVVQTIRTLTLPDRWFRFRKDHRRKSVSKEWDSIILCENDHWSNIYTMERAVASLATINYFNLKRIHGRMNLAALAYQARTGVAVPMVEVFDNWMGNHFILMAERAKGFAHSRLEELEAV
ncbi:hypothetical protein BKA67DRAFT_540634 [Truncatella angustata]|uniref:Uncharacterized protein n=1 Tax=Truncatella angustata TaxID=152316 RepID=A0A9P8RPX2_9PEZI|nr:uncharacterized protein BKA67DRAFT_540634 [Truncatella angustata]KAH6647185.1 hypothetical protein BKA67DRAFT_540634 [Truncatella angustata]